MAEEIDADHAFLSHFLYHWDDGLSCLRITDRHKLEHFLAGIEDVAPSTLAQVYILVIQAERTRWYARDDDCRRLGRTLIKMINLQALFLDVPGFDHPAIITALCAHEKSMLELFRIVLGKSTIQDEVDLSSVSLHTPPPPATVDPLQLRLREGKLVKALFVPPNPHAVDDDNVIYPEAYVNAIAQFLGASAKTLKLLSLRARCSKQFVACATYQSYQPPRLSMLMSHVAQLVQQPFLDVQGDVRTLELWWRGTGFLNNIEQLQFLGERFPSLQHLVIRARDTMPPTKHGLRNLGIHWLRRTKVREVTLALEIDLHRRCRRPLEMELEAIKEWSEDLPSLQSVAFQTLERGFDIWVRDHTTGLWGGGFYPNMILLTDSDLKPGCSCVRHGEGYACRIEEGISISRPALDQDDS